MTHAERARQLKPYIYKAAESLDDGDALEAVELFPPWEVGKAYGYGDRVRYNDVLYKCFQPHTSQENWTPDITPALWTEVAPPGEIPVWKQPIGVQDAYRIGDKVHYPTKEDPVYICTYDYNIYAPDVYGWELVV